jgi:hypothetical protein
MDKIKEAIRNLGYPDGDRYDLPSSAKTFPDGAHYRIEISGIERLANLQAMVDESEKRGVPVHRLIAMVGGPAQIPFEEIRDMAQLAAEKKYEVMVNVSTVRGWDNGRFPATEEGIWAGLTVRGMDGAYWLLKDMERLIEAGMRGFLLFDQGMMRLVRDLKAAGVFPPDIKIKASVVAGCGTPMLARLLRDNGADTINPVADITLPQLAAMRQVLNIPLDVYMTIVDSMGGMHRYHEAAELVRVGAPLYFKFEPGRKEGEIYKEWTDVEYQNFLCREKIKQAQCTIEWIERFDPALKLSAAGPADLVLCQP